jgi:hypothetical protein
MTTLSRPPTPESPTGLRKANATIDDLTAALANFTNTAFFEPVEVTRCCCEKDTCENSLRWAAYKAKLEERLVLSAGEFKHSGSPPMGSHADVGRGRSGTPTKARSIRSTA